MKRDQFLVTCEHGGNRIPSRYRALFDGHESLLPTHRGYDAGALRMAREMAAALDAPLFAATVSRLLIDLNRSIIHPNLYSEATRPASEAIRREIWQRYYLPYRTKVEKRIEQAYSQAERVIHISCHSFAPEIDGKLRDADVGLLYDPGREQEAAFCQRWRDALRLAAPALRVRMNYPYAGKSDGFTTALRRRHGGDRYLGIELEINQRQVFAGPRQWRETRRLVLQALCEIAGQEREGQEECAER